MEDNNLYALTARKNRKTSDSIWHTRLGHPSLKLLKVLSNSSCINASSWNKMHIVCSSCQLGKSSKLPFGSRNKIEKKTLLEILYDLWGPAPVESSQHMRYYVVFVDDHKVYLALSTEKDV